MQVLACVIRYSWKKNISFTKIVGKKFRKFPEEFFFFIRQYQERKKKNLFILILNHPFSYSYHFRTHWSNYYFQNSEKKNSSYQCVRIAPAQSKYFCACIVSDVESTQHTHGNKRFFYRANYTLRANYSDQQQHNGIGWHPSAPIRFICADDALLLHCMVRFHAHNVTQCAPPLDVTARQEKYMALTLQHTYHRDRVRGPSKAHKLYAAIFFFVSFHTNLCKVLIF